MNNLTWHATEAQKAYIRRVRWEKFRNFMSYWFWPLVLILGAVAMNWFNIGG